LQQDRFFDAGPYPLTLLVIGGATILAFWLPRFVSGREPAASALLILIGMGGLSFVPGLPDLIDPRQSPLYWEVISELAVIVALFGTGLRIDSLSDYSRWRPTVRLLAITMPLTIAAVALLGFTVAGMTLAGAILLGAVLAPTDPVLAGDVQVGPPTEGGEHPVRFALTTEAGLNDGLAFPFVYLGLLAGSAGFAAHSLIVDWFLLDILYRIAVGCVAGVAIGWLLGRMLFGIPRGNVLADTSSGVIGLAGVLLCYGATEMIEGYGFIASFVAGLTLRRVEQEHEFHAKLHSFNETIELALTALILLSIGAVMPRLWPELDWTHAAIATALVLLIRPAAGMAGLKGTDLNRRERMVVAFYGVRGVGSIYYLSFATSHMELVNEGQLWATIALTILLSTMIHGFSAGWVVSKIAPAEAR